MFKLITSSQNPRIKQLSRLKDRRERDETKLFSVEGFRELSRAQIGKVQFESLFICPELFLGDQEFSLIQKIATETYELPAHLFKKISYRDRPDGLIGIAHQMQTSLKEVIPKNQNPLYLVAEAIEKPGNLGTLLRSADAAGADGVIVCDRCTDIYNPNVVRASVGTLFLLPVIETTKEEALTWLQQKGIHLTAATPSASTEYTDASLHYPIAIIVGTEQLGLSDWWMQKADIQIKIPMKGQGDSLNVATAATLILYEAIRQRKNHLLR